MKTVSFDDEAYDILRGLKQSPKDSFSDVVKRHLGSHAKFADSAGSLPGFYGDRPLARLKRERIEAFGTAADDE